MEKRIQTTASLSARSFSVYLDEVRLKNGEVGKRIRVDHPEAAAVVPFVSGDEIIMVRQYRYALGQESLEIPAGKMDPGETAEACARRELLEETGYQAEEVRFLCTYAPAIGYSNERIHVYSGHGLKPLGRGVDEREIDAVERLTAERVKGLVDEGLILDGKTLIGLAMTGWIDLSR